MFSCIFVFVYLTVGPKLTRSVLSACLLSYIRVRFAIGLELFEKKTREAEVTRNDSGNNDIYCVCLQLARKEAKN